MAVHRSRILPLALVLIATACRPAGDGGEGEAAESEDSTQSAPPPAADTPDPAAEAEEREIAALPPDAPRIDIAFCLDGTGSMATVIDGAKAKIEEIAAWMRRGTPRPRLRFGLVIYRDREESQALENLGFVASAAAMKRRLASVVASGGGDGPEHVVAGLRSALVDLPWDETAALRVLFLIGDAEPHLDYGTDSDDGPVLETARQRKVTVSTIACGEMSEAGHRYWNRVAAETGGVYQALPGTSGAPVSVELEFEEAVYTTLRGQAGKAGMRYPAAGQPGGEPEPSPAP